ncbi:DUF1972 domain-containing protein [Robiginitalea marina]|uniref:DUF1972 domain-containing protein n=1 Tax=Robiginitalea marina TaxID=2954105 RepID=A0ABT1AW04_9FLAO|nr:DUF1972 domain-containing protein [Robiginitalea marina]MCO5724234.1 DUF1972 domain-containing protein [Robiginitalea marina]
MKVAILGTRGIPNHHGGFEQFAEFFSVYMAKKGHDVIVYNSHNHPYKKKEFQGVKIIHKYDPEHKIGTPGQFVYDFNCIWDCRRRGFDIILQLGYTSSSIWGKFLPNEAIILTNMDGLEWKRTKYTKKVQGFLKYAERWAVKTSDHLIADSLGIQDYLKDKYKMDSTYIPYGAELFLDPDESVLEEYNLKKNGYNMLIARLEPENNIEVILNAVMKDRNQRQFLVIGKHDTAYGRYLKQKFDRCSHIQFLGGIYNLSHLNNLRYFSNLYFHGHSVGGTNPSLLEAMASESFIVAHDNPFNRSILGEDAYYFQTSEDIFSKLSLIKREHSEWILSNKNKIQDIYNWPKINGQYEDLFMSCLEHTQ